MYFLNSKFTLFCLLGWVAFQVLRLFRTFFFLRLLRPPSVTSTFFRKLFDDGDFDNSHFDNARFDNGDFDDVDFDTFSRLVKMREIELMYNASLNSERAELSEAFSCKVQPDN